MPSLRTLLIAVAVIFAAFSPLGVSAAETLEPGQTVRGEFTQDDRIGDSGGRSRDYTLMLEGKKIVVLSAASGDFDTMLTFFDPDGELIGENDDRDDGSSNSLLLATTRKNGAYTVRIKGNHAAIGNAFTLKAASLEDDD